jgi:energy-coupling factor transporter transmembrane protein EcfT
MGKVTGAVLRHKRFATAFWVGFVRRCAGFYWPLAAVVFIVVGYRGFDIGLPFFVAAGLFMVIVFLIFVASTFATFLMRSGKQSVDWGVLNPSEQGRVAADIGIGLRKINRAG